MSNPLFLLQKVFREVFDNPDLTIGPETTTSDIPDWDSVAQVKIILALEAELGVRFKTEDVANLQSVEAFVRAIGSEIGG